VGLPPRYPVNAAARLVLNMYACVNYALQQLQWLLIEYWITYKLYHVPKKEATKLLAKAITFSNLNRFSKFLHCSKQDEYFQQNCVTFSTTP